VLNGATLDAFSTTVFAWEIRRIMGESAAAAAKKAAEGVEKAAEMGGLRAFFWNFWGVFGIFGCFFLVILALFC
jgi:hypothetical protein